MTGKPVARILPRMDSDDRVDVVAVNALWLDLVRVLLAGAALVAGYLAYQTIFEGAGLPGCGPSSGCDKVLSSPWAKWLGIPVSLPGLGLYLVFLVSTWALGSDDLQKAKRALNGLILCCFGVIGVALWFLGVQAIVLEAFCPFCCVAHGLASTGAVVFLLNARETGSQLGVRLNMANGFGAAIGLVVLMAMVQIFMPSENPGLKVVNLGKKKNGDAQGQGNGTAPGVEKGGESDNLPMASTVSADGKWFLIPGSDFRLEMSQLPLMGRPDARHKIGLLFDYTCHFCRDLHSYVRSVVDEFDEDVACVLIAMPLDADCNGLVEETMKAHVNACKFAKICMAVHIAVPDKYEEFDRWLFSDHKNQKELEAVKEFAEDLAGKERLDEALASEALEKQLQMNIKAHEILCEHGRDTRMPQAVVGPEVVFGPAPSLDEVKRFLVNVLQIEE